MRLREIDPDYADFPHELRAIKVDKDGIAVMVPKARLRFFKIEGLSPAGANILKQEALSYGAEAAVPIGVINCKTPRADVILYGDQRRLGLIAQKLRAQPYGLGELARQLEEALAGGEPVWEFGKRRLTFSRPLIMGVLNVTPDSFYDGGKYTTEDQIRKRAEELVEGGADILDVGAESTRPGAEPVPLEEEMERAVRAVELVRDAVGQEPVVSVDTYKSPVADACGEAGAEVINDISGATFDPGVFGVAKKRKMGIILGHIKGTPKNMQKNPTYQDTIAEIYDFLEGALGAAEARGVAREAIALDPGIGFGKRLFDNLLILKRIRDFMALGRPVVVGHSRKSFIGAITGRSSPAERLAGSLAVAGWLAAKGVHVIRTHDPAETLDAVKVALAIKNPWEYL